MNIAIVYATKHGTTAEIASRIGQALAEQGLESTLIDLEANPNPAISGYDAVIAGGPTYMGQPMKSLKTFLVAQASALLIKPLALFICGMETDPAKLQSAINTTFPASLQSHACGIWYAGGAFRFDKLGFMEKTIIKKVANSNQTVTKLIDEVPTQIAAAMRDIFNTK